MAPAVAGTVCRHAASFSLAMLVLVATAAGASAANFGQGLTGWWQFDDGNAAIATDASGLGNDGILSGDVFPTTDALRGKALDFTDLDGLVTIPHTPSLEPVTGTIEVWVKVDTLQDSDIYGAVTDCKIRTDPSCSVPTGISVIGLRIQADGGAHAFVADDHVPGNPWVTASAPAGLLTADVWHHLAMRWDGETVAIFVDGVVREAVPYDAIPGSGLSYHGDFDSWLGLATAWPTPGPHDFIGQLDDVRFYARARADVEIFTDYVTKGRKPAKPLGH